MFETSKRKNDMPTRHWQRWLLVLLISIMFIIGFSVYALTHSMPRPEMPFAPLVYQQTTGERYALNFQTGERFLTNSSGIYSDRGILPDGNWRVSSWLIKDQESHESLLPLALQSTTMAGVYLDTGRLSFGGVSWSSDSHWIVFPSHAPNCFSDPTVGLYTRLPSTPRLREEYCMRLSWSVDELAASELWLMNVRTGDVFPITDDKAAEKSAVFSPRQPQIIYTREGALYLYDVDKREEHLLFKGESVYRPVWSPDGLWIAFIAGEKDTVQNLYIIRPDGTSLLWVANDLKLYEPIHWVP